MFKNLLIFAIVAILATRIVIKNKNKAYWYNFSWAGDLHQTKKSPDGKNRFFIYDGYGKPFIDEINFNKDLGILIRLIFCEAGSESYKCKVAVGESIRNRFYSNCYSFSYFDGLKAVIYQPGQYGCIKGKRFLDFQSYLDNSIERNAFLDSVSAGLKVVLQRSYWFPENMLHFRSDNEKPTNTASRYKTSCNNNFWIDNC